MLDEMLPVLRTQVSRDLLPTHERWVADKRIESPPVKEDLGKLQRQWNGRDTQPPPDGRSPQPPACRGVRPESIIHFLRAPPFAAGNPLGRLRRLPAYRQQAVGSVVEPLRLGSDVGEEPLFSSTLAMVSSLIFSRQTRSSRVASMIFGIMFRKFGSVIPMPCRRARSWSTACAADAHQRIAAADGVVEERERLVLLPASAATSDSFAISTASGFLSTPYRHRSATIRRA